MAKVQFNLLPDIKLEYNRLQHTKRTVFSIAFLVTASSVALFIILLLTVDVLQKKQMNDAGKAVDQASKQLTSIPQINQIITVQNQLSALSQLHQSKHVASRIYTYLPQLTPANVTINKLDLDLKLNTITITGKASSQANVNAFVDALKFATYKVTSSDSAALAFPSVVESGFTINATGIGYTVNIQFDPKLFANTQNDQGKSITPQLTVKKPASGSSLSPGSTLFNSSQSSGGQ